MTRDTNEIDEETRNRIAFNRCVDVITNLIKKYVYYIFDFDLTKERLQSYRDIFSK